MAKLLELEGGHNAFRFVFEVREDFPLRMNKASGYILQEELRVARNEERVQKFGVQDHFECVISFT